jgi:hypothetical protein
LAPLGEDVPFNVYQFIAGKSINGTYFGGIVKREIFSVYKAIWPGTHHFKDGLAN